jgi:hypothetical protein
MSEINPSNDNVFTSLPEDVLADRIFPFVGPNQYRFVGGVCNCFKNAYCAAFPALTTHYELSTMHHAKMCFQGAPKNDRKMLRRLAAKQSWYYMIRLDNFSGDDWKLLQYIKKTFRCPWGALIVANTTNPDTCAIAARNGDMKALQFARSKGCPWNESTCIQAALNGHEEVLNWALENGCPWHGIPCSSAVFRFVGGIARHLKEMYGMNFREKTTDYDMSTMKNAKISFEGAPQEIKPLLQQRASMQAWYWYMCIDDLNKESWALLQWTKATFQCPWGALIATNVTSPEACSGAARNGDLEMLQFVRAHGCPWNKDTCQEAARNGHLELLKWAHEIGCPWDEGTCCAAAGNGHFEILLWARTNGCPWNADVCFAAAENGRLEILQWLHGNGCPWNATVCRVAAENGCFDVLQWARANECPWDSNTCSSAAENGHLKILKWARENGCPWDKYSCSSAAENGHLETLQWAHENGCPWDGYTRCAAALGGQFETWTYARDNGCPFSREIRLEFPPRRPGDTPILRRLRFEVNASWDEIQTAILECRAEVARLQV